MLAVSNSLLEKLNSLVLVINQNGAIDYVSPSVQKILGFAPEELVGEGWYKLTKATEQERTETKNFISQLIKKQSQAQDSQQFERSLLSKWGELKWILYNSATDTDNSTVFVGQDITARKNAELKLLQNHIELKKRNTEITQSIEYAQNIQRAILPDIAKLKNIFSDAFVLYKPKDVVSGDLYFYYQNVNKVYVAVADCTGHGVPGAMMSVIANTALSNVIEKKKIVEPCDILNHLDTEFAEILNKQGNETVLSDGMDIALVMIDFDTMKLTFSGAFRPLLLSQKNELIEWKGSRYPIGFYNDVGKKFACLETSINYGDSFYLFTDGYVDQFGGEAEKKLNRSRFLDILQTAQEMDLSEQEAFLDYAFLNWKQDNLQTDDVCIVGVKI